MSQFALPEGIASTTGVVDRDGVRLAYAVSGAAATACRRSCCCRPGRSSRRGSGRRRSPTCPATTAS